MSSLRWKIICKFKVLKVKYFINYFEIEGLRK